MISLQMLEGRNLSVGYPEPILSNLDISVKSGEIMGLYGPSGAGKTSLGRVLAGLQKPLAGQVLLEGKPLPTKGRRAVQYLYQSAASAMNPRWSLRRILQEAGSHDPDIAHFLGVEAAWFDRYPHEISGGQLMRLSLLRALTVQPKYLIADEISAPLDAINQARLWGLLSELAQSKGLGILAISHDLALLQKITSAGIQRL